LHEALAEAEERDEALGLLRGFIDRIDMAPVDGGFEIELTGNIAHMVEASLAGPGSEKAVLDERTACSVKVVAGARNRLDLLLTMTAMSP